MFNNGGVNITARKKKFRKKFRIFATVQYKFSRSPSRNIPGWGRVKGGVDGSQTLSRRRPTPNLPGAQRYFPFTSRGGCWSGSVVFFDSRHAKLKVGQRRQFSCPRPLCCCVMCRLWSDMLSPVLGIRFVSLIESVFVRCLVDGEPNTAHSTDRASVL